MLGASHVMASVKTPVIKGTNRADTLTGTGAVETINALNGNDTIRRQRHRRRRQRDRHRHLLTVDNYALQWLPDGSLQVVGADGTDKLLNVEYLQYGLRGG